MSLPLLHQVGVDVGEQLLLLVLVVVLLLLFLLLQLMRRSWLMCSACWSASQSQCCQICVQIK
jgi:hypothetical protein